MSSSIQQTDTFNTLLHPWRIDAVEEMRGAARPPGTLLPAWAPGDLDTAPWLSPDHIDPATGNCVMSVGGWLLRGHGRTLLLDVGAGAGKPRPSLTRYDRAPDRFLPALARLGVEPDAIDTVVLSHLHVDHVGGTTVASGDGWAPAFPKARYLVGQVELDDMRRKAAAPAPGSDDDLIFQDSVAPLLAAGLLDGVALPATIAPGVTMEMAAGHTRGHTMVRVVGDTAEGLVTFDVAHSVLQVLHPDWNTVFCEHPDLACTTRRRVLEEASRRGLLLYPTHFGHAGPFRVTAEGGGYRPFFLRQDNATSVT